MLRRFLLDLFEGGVITLPAAAAAAATAADAEDGGVSALLNEAEAHHRLDLPATAPAWDPAVGLWAARVLFDACRALAHREIPADQVSRSLSVPPPTSGTPSAHYSADVPLRALPDVLRLARGLSHDDPLTIGLLALARAWPLSSVGVRDLGPVDVAGFIDDRSLRLAYAQRIVERDDLGRLGDEGVRRAVRDVLGGYPSLAPSVARRLGEAATHG